MIGILEDSSVLDETPMKHDEAHMQKSALKCFEVKQIQLQ